MNQVSLLRKTLKPLLGWHGARLNFLALFLIALLRVKTINLTELTTGFRSNAKTASCYKRLQRFFRNFDLDYSVIAKLVVTLMNIPQPWILSTESGKILVWGRLVYVSALRLDNGELLIVINPDSCSSAISDYGQQWGIETLFGMFKTRGFCLESTFLLIKLSCVLKAFRPSPTIYK